MAYRGLGLAFLIGVAAAGSWLDILPAPCDKKYILIDATASNKYSWSRLQKALRPFTTLFAVRVPSTKRYVVVIEDPGSASLGQLNIPAVSSRVYRVQRADRFFIQLGAVGMTHCGKVPELMGEELYFLEVDYVMTGMDLANYKAKMAWLGDTIGAGQATESIHIFYVIDSLPAKVFAFREEVPSHAVDLISGMGDPHVMNVDISPIIRLDGEPRTN